MGRSGRLPISAFRAVPEAMSGTMSISFDPIGYGCARAWNRAVALERPSPAPPNDVAWGLYISRKIDVRSWLPPQPVSPVQRRVRR